MYTGTMRPFFFPENVTCTNETASNVIRTIQTNCMHVWLVSASWYTTQITTLQILDVSFNNKTIRTKYWLVSGTDIRMIEFTSKS